MVTKYIFGPLLILIGIFYFWFAWMSVVPQSQSGDIVSYIAALMFMAPGVGAAFAGINLLRTKRR
jgi:membrane protein insertase Oxa1/YidC/SpoIIIJ